MATFAFKGPASLTGASTISTTGNLACTGSGAISTAGGNISSTSGAITTGGNISTTAGGTVTAAGLITASAGLTCADGQTVTTSGLGKLVTDEAGGLQIGANTLSSVARDIDGTTGDSDTQIASTAWVQNVAASISVGATYATINTTGNIAPSGDTHYSVATAGGAVTSTITNVSIASLSNGDKLSFVVTDDTNNFTLALESGIFKMVGGDATTLVFDTAGQGISFMLVNGQLWVMDGGYTSST